MKTLKNKKVKNIYLFGFILVFKITEKQINKQAKVSKLDKKLAKINAIKAKLESKGE